MSSKTDPICDNVHEHCFKFAVDFDTKGTIAQVIGRLQLGNGSCMRLYFSQKGLCAVIGKSAVDDGIVKIYDDNEAQITI